MHTGHAQMSLKEKQRQEREDLILQAAEEAFAEKGYQETSMDEIAGRVGISKGTVYLHFSCKEDLVVAIFTRDTERLLEAVEAASTVGSTARAKLEAVLSCIYSSVQKKQAQFLSEMYRGLEMKRMLAENSCRMKELWSRLTALVTSLLEEGKAAGEFDSSLPTDVMLLTFFGLLSPKASEHFSTGSTTSPETFVKHVGRIYFDGVGAK